MDGPNPWPTLLYRRSDGLEFTTGQSPWPGAQQWSFPTITVEDELISTLPLSTHSAVEMLHDSALYKFMLDIDIDIWHWHDWLLRYRGSLWLVSGDDVITSDDHVATRFHFWWHWQYIIWLYLLMLIWIDIRFGRNRMSRLLYILWSMI